MEAKPGFGQEHLAGSLLDFTNLYEQWMSFIHRHIYIAKLDSAANVERNFAIDARGRTVGDWSLSRIISQAGKSQITRTRAEIGADPRERYMAYLSLRDRIEFEQFGRDSTASEASLTIVSGTDGYVHRKLGDNDTLCFALPREFVDQRVARPENLCSRPIAVQTGVGGLVRHSLLSLHDESVKMSDEEFLSACEIVGDLVLLSLDTIADLSASVSPVRTGNLARAKRIIRLRLSDPGLDPATIANECGISRSYLHDLFRDDGRSVSQYLLEERLRKARQLLQRGNVSVTEVAMACGFSNLSSFSTVFRKTFAQSPRDVLQSAARNAVGLARPALLLDSAAS